MGRPHTEVFHCASSAIPDMKIRYPLLAIGMHMQQYTHIHVDKTRMIKMVLLYGDTLVIKTERNE